MDARIPQRDLFASQGDPERRPSVAALVPQMIAALDNRGWVGAKVLTEELQTDRRALREAGHRSNGLVVGNQRGYALTSQVSLEDVHKVTRRLLSQSHRMKARVLEIERVRHGCGDVMGGAA